MDKTALHSEMNQQLLSAHADKDFPLLTELYTLVANLMENAGDTDAMCFYLTHAYVYALESDAPQLSQIFARLDAHGRV